MPQADPLRPGDPKVLGSYRLIGRLGEGGQGTVFLGAAADSADSADSDGPGAPGGSGGSGAAVAEGARVAIKLLHARLSGDAKARSRFAAEVAVAQRVSPFCTARLLDADVEGDTPYIVSEFIDGSSLQDVVTAEGPRAGTALHRLAIGTITALTAIHQAGVVHRDLKPSNVLLAADGPRVIDFGIARALDATGTLSSTTVGTPAYMSPEQISGTLVGPAADVFAWGCTIAFAAGGRPPFGQDSIPAVLHRILNLPPDLSMLDAPLHDLVSECLVKDPSARPAAQTVLLRLLGHADAPPQGSPSAAVLTEGAQAAGPGSPPPPSATHMSPAPPAPPAAAPPPGPAPAHGSYGAYGAYGSYGTDPSGARQAPTHPSAPPPYRPTAGPYASTPPRRRRTRPLVLAGAGTAGFVALVLIGTFTLIRIGTDSAPPTPRPGGVSGGTLRMATAYAPEAIDPSNATFGPDVFIAKQLFTGLTEITPDGRVVRRLAEDLQPDASCRTWTITIKQGTTFSNGEAVDPQAFARGWNRAAKSEDGYGLFVMDEIKGYREVNTGPAESLSGVESFPNGLRVNLTRPDCEFDRRLAAAPFFPVPAAAGDVKNTAYNNRPVGNGPFRVESYTADSKLTLVRNDLWFAGRAKLDRITLDLTVPSGGAVAAFDSGRYDWAEVNSADINNAKARHRGDGQLQSRLVNGIDFLIPVTARGPLRSKQAREALSYAIDRNALNNTVYGGTRPPATGLVPPAVPGFRRGGICPSCETPDPAKARQLAAAAGLGPGTEVTFVSRNSASASQGGDAIAQRIESVLGWKVNRRGIDSTRYPDFTKALTGGGATGFGRSAWFGDYTSAYNFLHSLIGGGQTSELSDWRDSRFDELLARAIQTSDEAGRNQLIQQAEKIALDDMAIIPLWVATQTRLVDTKEFTGLNIDHDGDPTLATAARK
ncbi:MAG TPA: ABC transporter substrate-binding protein [Streptosporangiaceae bacterium]|nr:ABC transporter substrate-binding protein [Streptosporangiaceae bacterium]